MTILWLTEWIVYPCAPVRGFSWELSSIRNALVALPSFPTGSPIYSARHCTARVTGEGAFVYEEIAFPVAAHKTVEWNTATQKADRRTLRMYGMLPIPLV